MATFTNPSTVSTALEIFTSTTILVTSLASLQASTSDQTISSGLKDDIDQNLRNLMVLIDQTRAVIEAELPAVP